MKALQQMLLNSRFYLAVLIGLVVFLAGSGALALEKLQVGMKAPLFELEDLGGRLVRLVAQRDAKVTVVVFWATWSDHSPTLLGRLQELYQKHGRERMSVLAVNVDRQELTAEDLKKIESLVSRQRISYPVQIDKGLRIFREYGVVAVPSTVVVDEEGIIRGEMAAYPIAQREDLFDLIDDMATGRQIPQQEELRGYRPIPKAVRYYNLAAAMASRGMIDVVDDNLKKSIATDPQFVLPLLFLARLYRERAETEEAVEYKGSSEVTATFSAEREDYLKEAAELVARALEIEPEGAPVLTEAALIHLSRGERNRAKEHLQKAVDVEPNYTPARFAMASLLVREGKVKEGMAEFETALRLNPLGHEGYYTMAVAYEEREMKKESIEAYKKVYEILYQENQLFPSSYGR